MNKHSFQDIVGPIKEIARRSMRLAVLGALSLASGEAKAHESVNSLTSVLIVFIFGVS